MKRRGFFNTLTVFFLILLLGITSACGMPKGEETISENLSLEYLKGDYTSQLLTDGSEHLVGSIELDAAEDGSPLIIVHPKEVSSIVNSDGTRSVSSYAINRILSVSDSLFATVSGNPSILTADEFLTAVKKDYEACGSSFDDYGDYILYDVYALEDQALLILYNSDYVLSPLTTK